MWRAWIVVEAVAFYTLIASADCDSGCLAESDEISLLQKAMEPDMVWRAQSRKVELGSMPTTTPSAAVEGADAKLNHTGDLSALFAAVEFNSLCFICLVVTFIVLQRYYPMIYAHPATHEFSSPDKFKGDAPYRWSSVYNKSWFGWARVSYMVTSQEIEASCGLDAAMLLVYTQLAMELMATIGLPACMIGIPIYVFLGGRFARDDKLSWAGLGNVVFNDPDSDEALLPYQAMQIPRVQWIYWLVAWTVWAVVIYVQLRLYVYQRRFLERRMEWLRNMQEPRSTTVLVTGIGEEHRTDAKLYHFFSEMFGSNEIDSAFVVKNLARTELPTLMADYEQKVVEHQHVEYAMKKPLLQICSKRDIEHRGRLKLDEILALYDDSADFRDAFARIDVERHDLQDSAIMLKDHATNEVEYRKLVDVLVGMQEKKLFENQLENHEKTFLDAMQQTMFEKTLLEERIAKEQLRIKRIAALSAAEGSIEDKVEQEKLYSTCGFVTFTSRTGAARCLGLQMSEDTESWVIETPPQPDDVRYHDLEVDETETAVFQLWGYVAVGALLFALTPLVACCMSIMETPAINQALTAAGMKDTAGGVLPSMGLTIMMSMLPSLLMWIFQAFFFLKANRWAQLHLQEFYFGFLVLLVIFVAAIGANLAKTLQKLAQSPFEAFTVLAESLPLTTHFYLSFCLMQCVTHALNLTRYMNMMKFLVYKRSYDEEAAREMAEPEDQDYYGIGSRSARFTLMLVIGLVFGTICPLMNVVVILNFAACRLIYGYLIPFAEGRKIDQGGEHWCMQLKHTHIGLLVYIILMTGILMERAESIGPAVVSAISFLWWFISYRRFIRHLRWENLSYTDLTNVELWKDIIETTKPGKDERIRLDLNKKVYGQSELEWTAPVRK